MEYYLQHHGVKGMKWGVRKKQHKTLGNRYYSWQAKGLERDAARANTEENAKSFAYSAKKARKKASASQAKYDERKVKERTPTGNIKKDSKKFAKLNKRLFESTLSTLRTDDGYAERKTKMIVDQMNYSDFLNSAKIKYGKDYVNEMIRYNNKKNRSMQLYEI